MQILGYFHSATLGFRQHIEYEHHDHLRLSLSSAGIQQLLLIENMWTYIVCYAGSKGGVNT
jgi:hypothetical protein